MQTTCTMRTLLTLILTLGCINLDRTALGLQDDDSICGKKFKDHAVGTPVDCEKQTNCRKEVCHRFHCCPENLEDLTDPKLGAEYMSCDLDTGKKIAAQGVTFADQKDEICDCLEVHEIDGEKGRCKIPGEKKRKVKRLEEFFDRDTEEALNIWEREIWTLPHNLQRKYTLKQECNIGLYNERKMGEFWDRFLLCPLDYDYFQTFMNKIFNEALFYPDLLKKLCLASENLEECRRDPNGETKTVKNNNGVDEVHEVYRCGCLTREYNFRRWIPEHRGGPCVYSYNFTQIDEGLKCGQLAGATCQFNWKDLRNPDDIGLSPSCPPEKPTDNVKSPHEHLAKCLVKGDAILGMNFSDNMDCEEDALCGAKLKLPSGRCTLADSDSCRCVCVEGHKCKGSRGSMVKGSSTLCVFPFLLTIKMMIF